LTGRNCDRWARRRGITKTRRTADKQTGRQVDIEKRGQRVKETRIR
jgi:hypothetical protein